MILIRFIHLVSFISVLCPYNYKMKKTLLVTGGTGSFGNAVVKKFLKSKVYSEIRIYSRDESKQDRMALNYNNRKLKFFLGYIRDKVRNT